MTDITDHARGALRAQPFSMLLGTELMHIGDNEVSLCLPVREELRQQHGFVHGGVISYLADNALTFAGALVLGPRVITAEYKINYLRPAVNGTLVARAKLVYAGGTRRPASVMCSSSTAITSGSSRSRRARSTASATARCRMRRRKRRERFSALDGSPVFPEDDERVAEPSGQTCGQACRSPCGASGSNASSRQDRPHRARVDRPPRPVRALPNRALRRRADSRRCAA